jgi:D-serine deaminase-like pyridoxal phosphate-dependent protein
VATPCLALDHEKLDANLARMASAVQARGISLRPHLKTAKCVEVAKRAAHFGNAGFCVSTLKEAEFFFSHGFRDLFYAVTAGPGKLDRAATLLRDGASLVLAVDTLAAAQALAISGERNRVKFKTCIEIDCGGARCGVDPRSAELLGIATILDRTGSGAELAGVFTHAGNSYSARGIAQIREIAGAEISAVTAAAESLRKAGYACETVSAGSTPTSLYAPPAGKVTEARCGVYMFGDLFQAGIGTCRIEDIAVSVVTEIISHHPERNSLVIDAGALALSKDRSTRGSKADCEYGLVMTLEGDELLKGFRVSDVSQEHGVIHASEPVDFKRFPIGSRLRVLPNHACLTAAAYDRYMVVANGTNILDEWTRDNGW